MRRRASSPPGDDRTVCAAILHLGIGFGAGNQIQCQQLQSTLAELTIDRQRLVIMTSTDTVNIHLAPVPPLGGDIRGHWFHRAGADTEVLAIEAMPTAPTGEAYWGWLQRTDGTWIAAGRFALDRTVYARIILIGSDGTDVKAIENNPDRRDDNPIRVLVHWGPAS